MSDQGGELRSFFKPDTLKGEVSVSVPCFLPDGETLIFAIGKRNREADLVVYTAGEIRNRFKLEQGIFFPGSGMLTLTYSSSGHIMYSSVGNIRAVPFSLEALEFSGPSFPVARNASSPSVSLDGTLTYYSVSTDSIMLHLVWVDRTGQITKTIASSPGFFGALSLSPNETHIAVDDATSGNPDIWLYETSGGARTRLTSHPALDSQAVWSPKGDRILFASLRSGLCDLYTITADGLGDPQLLVSGPLYDAGPNWSRDGKYLIYHAADPKTNRDLYYRTVDGSGEAIPLRNTPSHEVMPHFSPDDKYVAYVSDETGRWEVYVTPFPSGQGKLQISFNGGMQPRWGPRGDELFYVEDNTLMAVKVETQAQFRTYNPERLFSGVKTQLQLGGAVFRSPYDVSADGQRFVAIQTTGLAVGKVTVVQNWAREFEGRE